MDEKDQRIADLEAKLADKSNLSFKVSEKGGLSVYGLQRFPVTLYPEQWERVFEAVPRMKEFLHLHLSEMQALSKRFNKNGK